MQRGRGEPYDNQPLGAAAGRQEGPVVHAHDGGGRVFARGPGCGIDDAIRRAQIHDKSSLSRGEMQLARECEAAVEPHMAQHLGEERRMRGAGDTLPAPERTCAVRDE